MKKKREKSRRLYAGMRKSIKAHAWAWGGNHVGKRDCDIVLLFDSEEYCNIPNINLTDENAIKLADQIVDSLSQTVMHDLFVHRLAVKDIQPTLTDLCITLQNKEHHTKRNITWNLKASDEQLIELRSRIDKTLLEREQERVYKKYEKFVHKL